MRILAIDDDPALGAMLATCNAAVAPAARHEFVLATSDDAALSLLEADTDFDLALVSIDGGSVSGLSVFRRLVDRSLRVPRVALSAGQDVRRVTSAIGDGAADILLKPLHAEEFAPAIERVMQRVARRRRNWHERSAYMALRREVDIAADMQRRVLPQRFPQHVGLDVDAIMRPARGVGGDFYDMFALDETHVALLVADVSGKGIPAAFYMAIASTTLRSVAMRGVSPGECLTQVNELLVGRDIPGMFVSVFYAVLDTVTWQLRCSNAGHSPPLLYERSSATVRSCASEGGTILGILSDETYQESVLDLPPAGTLLLYTDGVTEAYNQAREQFGEQRLADVVTAAAATGSASALIGALDTALESHVGDSAQHDDVTALVIQRRE